MGAAQTVENRMSIAVRCAKDRQAKGGSNPRPGRTLASQDVDLYRAIVGTVGETLRIQCEIDAVIEERFGWPDAFQTEAPEK